MKEKRMLGLQIGLLAIFAGSVSAMYFVDETQKIAMYINASVFWGSLLLLIIISCLINRRRKKRRGKENATKRKRRIGLISFFRNKPAIIMDYIMIVSLIVLIVLILINTQAQLLVFLCISIFIFSFGMHCILNGKNYAYIREEIRKGKDKKGEEHE